MTIHVADTSTIVDLRRARLAEVVTGLPCDIAVPDPLYRSELLGEGGERLARLGLLKVELDECEVMEAARQRRRLGRLSINDLFALALAGRHGWQLLAGEPRLQDEARACGIGCGTILWLFDEIESAGLCPLPALADCLDRLARHRCCQLSRREIEVRLGRYGRTGQ